MAKNPIPLKVTNLANTIKNLITTHEQKTSSSTEEGHAKAGGVPQALGTSLSAGTDNGYYARADHVHTVDYNNVLNKPTTFNPATHNHDDFYLIKDSGVYDGVLYISYDNQEDLSLTIDDVYEETYSFLQTNYIFHLIDTQNINTSIILKDEEEKGIEGVVISIKDENDNLIGKNVTDNNGESSVSFDMGDDDTKSIKAVTKNLETDIETFYYTYKDTNTFKIMLLWNDNNNSSNKRPSSVTVYCSRSDIGTYETISLNEANGWQVTREYPLEDEYGNTYTYEWDISSVSSYLDRAETYNNLIIGILSLIDSGGSVSPTPTDDDTPGSDVPTRPGETPGDIPDFPED